MKGDLRQLRPMNKLFSMLVILLFGTACASTGGPDGTGQDGIRVHVENNLIPSTTVSISAVTDAGAPVQLGTLIAGAEQTFTYRPTVRTGTFRLVADPPGPSRQLVSEPIVFPDGGTGSVSWELSTNNVIVQ